MNHGEQATEDPEAAHLQHRGRLGVAKRLEQGEGELLVRPKVLGLQLVHVFRLAPHLLELMAAAGEEAGGEQARERHHEDGENPLPLLQAAVEEVDDATEDETDRDAHDAAERNGAQLRVLEEGRDQEDADLCDLAPDVPGHVEAELGVGDADVLLLLRGVQAKPLRDLQRERGNAEGRNDLGHALDDLRNGVVELRPRGAQADAERQDQHQSQGSRNASGNPDGSQGRVLPLLLPFLLRIHDAAVLPDDDTGLQHLTRKDCSNGHREGGHGQVKLAGRQMGGGSEEGEDRPCGCKQPQPELA
mmetsp:Transcript_46676/g.139342  ORF Transcript_46676/g.139342 Transcript_46676/m.139342 type:complete len:303 (+) Transcript_46676:185-1093(+)